MSKLRTLSVIVLSVGLLAVANSQEPDLRRNGGASAIDQSAKPTRGMSQDSVRASFGSPRAMIAAVGEPPISRWEYPGFVVFFEYDRVIHSVTTR